MKSEGSNSLPQMENIYPHILDLIRVQMEARSHTQLTILYIFSSISMRSWVQVLETASCRNVGKGCVHKNLRPKVVGPFPVAWTLHKRELHAPGYPL
jgi:hypothetical protein